MNSEEFLAELSPKGRQGLNMPVRYYAMNYDRTGKRASKDLKKATVYDSVSDKFLVPSEIPNSIGPFELFDAGEIGYELNVLTNNWKQTLFRFCHKHVPEMSLDTDESHAFMHIGVLRAWWVLITKYGMEKFDAWARTLEPSTEASVTELLDSVCGENNAFNNELRLRIEPLIRVIACQQINIQTLRQQVSAMQLTLASLKPKDI